METIEPQVLDACGLINLCASGHVTEISEFVGGLFVVEDVAAEAARSIAVAGAAVRVLALSDFEAETFVALASIDGMDAGEAATFAAAAHRRMPVVTDDRRAIRVARDRLQGIRINSTPALIRAYAEGAALEDGVVRDLILGIEGEASFVPAPGGINVNWWQRYRVA
jgi:predicted nucleic acid-binding protein